MTLRTEVIACTRCPRLREHCAEVARVKRRAYRDESYWGRPIPRFGRADARALVLGLAPGNHGANRTGRVFTGDSSGDWLYRALYEHGFANQPESTGRRDGLRLQDAAITCVVKCAPPQNKPNTSEIAACRPWLERELDAMRRLRVVIALGRIAFQGFLAVRPFAPRPDFSHGGRCEQDGITLLTSYHPSRQNTNTKRLTKPMFDRVFRTARTILGEP
ncbi:MAG: uracil-DNA glycosylase [Planctomycetota bacterium]